MGQVERVFDPTPRSVGESRRFVRTVVLALRLEGVLDSAVLAVSELATNVVLHARTPFVVSVEERAGGVLLGVRDTSPLRPSARAHGVEATTGRGLAILDAVSERWWVAEGGDGKTVWVELRADAASGGDAERTRARSAAARPERRGSVAPPGVQLAA